jgi:ribosome biogenesis SPOUT family RNA methylase Rps3
VTVADLDDEAVTTAQVSVSARHEAELDDGSRVLLLDDRGWGSSGSWTETTVEDVLETTRMVVGPDEPPEDRSYEDMAAGHWAYLQRILETRGVVVDAAVLRRLPHDILLSRRLLARLGHGHPAG